MADRHGRRLRQEALAFGAIRAISGATIAILALIVGFILAKGLRFSNEVRSPYLPFAEEEPEGMALVVNAATGLARVDYEVLRGMFTDEYINWSKIDASDLELLPVAVDPGTADGASAERLLFGDAPAWGGLVAFEPDAAAALARVAATPGAAALVPAQAARGKPEIKTLRLSRLVLATEGSAAELVDNRSVRDIAASEASRLLAGAFGSWAELGGPELPIVPLAPPEGSSLAEAVRAAGLPAHAAPAASMDEYLAALATTPGAVGPLFGAQAAALELPALAVKGRERGWNLTIRYLLEAPRLSGKVGGISTIILNTLLMLALTVLVAAPVGVAAAVYLVEYARQGPLVAILRLGTETLAGIPSIIFGLFGMLFFVDILGFGFGLLSGSLTLTLMILPTIVRTSEEALKSVAGSLREGSLALGATKLQTIARVVLPAASPGILTGLILAVGRAVGETAALLFTMGSDYKLAKGLFSSARSLSAHVYLLFAEGISFDRAFSTAAVLVAVVLAFNLAAKRLVANARRSSGRLPDR